jgi:hypothetical protein
VFYSVDPTTYRAELIYRWREAADLPETRGRHTRGGGTRENTRVVTQGAFEALPNIAILVDRLFGEEERKAGSQPDSANVGDG